MGGITGVVFSPDSKRFAYTAFRGTTALVVSGDKEMAYDAISIWTLGFSPDSQHLSFAAITGSDAFLVTDGQRDATKYSGPGPVRVLYSPDGKHVAIHGPRGNGGVFVMDGVEGKVYERILQDGIGFSSDSAHFAFRVERDKKEFVVIDGVEGKGYAVVRSGDQLFLNARSVRYLGMDSDGMLYRVETDLLPDE